MDLPGFPGFSLQAQGAYPASATARISAHGLHLRIWQDSELPDGLKDDLASNKRSRNSEDHTHPGHANRTMEKPKSVKHLKTKDSKETVRRYGEELLQLSDKLLSDDLEAIFGLMLPMLEKEEDDLAIMKTFVANICEKGQLGVDERRRMMFRLTELQADLTVGKASVLDLLTLFRKSRLSREQKG